MELLAIVLKPFVAIVLFGFVALPISLVIKKYLPEGRLKRLLFFTWRT